MPTQCLKAAQKRNQLTAIMASSSPAPNRIWEYRICLPMSVEEYHIAQLWSVAQASKNETGGGEGLEVLINEPFYPGCNSDYLPKENLVAGGKEYTSGQYTKKIYHLQSKVPAFIRAVAPKGSLQIHEDAWNAYPYCRTIISNPGYMKDAFYICIESFHAPDRGDQANVHDLDPDTLKKREVHHIDIADNSVISRGDYKEEWDPTKLKRHEESNRGPLDSPGQQQTEKCIKGKDGTVVGQQGEWSKTHEPVMCCYKLVKVLFKWWGLQNRVEKFIMKQEKRIFTNFHRQVYCWIPNWYGLTMEDIRAIEEKTKKELDEQRKQGGIRGTKAEDSD